MAWQARALRALRAAVPVRWLIRFLGWSTLLALPAIGLSGPYQRALIAAVTGLFALFGLTVEMVDLNVMAPVDLALFTAMVLASRRAAPLRRRRALLFGLPALVGVELLAIVSGMALVLAGGERGFATSMRAMAYLIETIPWIAAPLCWWIVLGPYEVPAGIRHGLTGGRA